VDVVEQDHPYDLVFHLRPDNGKLAPADVKTVWHHILQSTLKGDDLKKLRFAPSMRW
jgi:hypothetical protein